MTNRNTKDVVYLSFILILILLFLTTVGCGVAEDLNQNCGGDLKELCHNVFGGRKDRQQDEQIGQIDRRIVDLEVELGSLEDRLQLLGSLIEQNELSLEQINYIVGSNATSFSELHAVVEEMRAESNSLLLRIATLEGYTNIVEIHDLCGPKGSGVNEVLLKLSTGQYLASVSDHKNGKNTRLGLVKDGNWVTTDGTKCKFSVRNQGTEVFNEHY